MVRNGAWKWPAPWPPERNWLLLDEPAAGMNNQETAELMQTIQKIQKEFHLTILLIEHDMKLVMGISEK